MSQEVWKCPICSLREFKYGTSCPDFKAGYCENQNKAHVTGQHYLKQKTEAGKSIGIAQISDEEK